MKGSYIKWKERIAAFLARLGLVLPGKIMYIGGSDTLPAPLEREVESELIGRLEQGDGRARDLLIEHNLRLVAYIARYLSFSMKSSSAALLQVHPSLEEAARTCGASHMESLTDVTLPLIRPAMVSGFFLIFLPAMREVTTSILLYGPYTRTLGVQIYSLRDAGMIPQAAALARACGFREAVVLTERGFQTAALAG